MNVDRERGRATSVTPGAVAELAACHRVSGTEEMHECPVHEARRSRVDTPDAPQHAPGEARSAFGAPEGPDETEDRSTRGGRRPVTCRRRAARRRHRDDL